MLYIIGRKVLLLGLYCETIIRCSGEKSVKFHEDHSLVFFTPELGHYD
nr:MAG TPA: hypothetical protein [Caudoviricetes sp.]